MYGQKSAAASNVSLRNEGRYNVTAKIQRQMEADLRELLTHLGDIVRKL